MVPPSGSRVGTSRMQRTHAGMCPVLRPRCFSRCNAPFNSHHCFGGLGLGQEPHTTNVQQSAQGLTAQPAGACGRLKKEALTSRGRCEARILHPNFAVPFTARCQLICLVMKGRRQPHIGALEELCNALLRRSVHRDLREYCSRLI